MVKGCGACRAHALAELGDVSVGSINGSLGRHCAEWTRSHRFLLDLTDSLFKIKDCVYGVIPSLFVCEVVMVLLG